MPRLAVDVEVHPLRQHFTISRGARSEAVVVVATISDGDHVGRGECFPHSRYGETTDSVAEAITAVADRVAAGLDRDALLDVMPAGAARNALDCALWDLATKHERRRRPDVRAWHLAGLADFRPITTVFTLSIDAPETMAAKAAAAVSDGYGQLKVKLGSDDGRDAARIASIRAAAPDATIVVDANEGWRPADLPGYIDAMAAAGVSMLEQPLPAAHDDVLADIQAPLPIGADESCHTRHDLQGLVGKYDVVNIKLDKAGGLTEGLATAAAAKALGFDIMVGCMLGTSLAMAPAAVLAQQARFVDLDGPLWLARDRPHGIDFSSGVVRGFDATLWG